MKYFLFFVAIVSHSFLFSQFSDDFSDNEFTSNPLWSGDAGLYTITSGELNSQSPGAGTYYLSTPSTISSNALWEFYIDLKFSTSGANFVDVYLMSNATDLTLTTDGYFVRFGGTADEISLYNIAGGAETLLIDGVDGLINSSTSNPFTIKVSRTTSNDWELQYDDGATGSFLSAGVINDATVNTSSFFGVLIEQSAAASPINNHFFDNFNVSTIPVDLTSPVLVSAVAISANLVDVLFDEPVDVISSQVAGNYMIQGFSAITTATIDGVDPALIHLVPTTPLVNGSSYILETNFIEDLVGNTSSIQTAPFSYLIAESPTPGDIAINEIMADPDPIVGLKSAEYVELYNRSNKIFNLQNWKLGDNSSNGTIQTGWLMPGDYIVLTSTNNLDSFAVAIAVTSFPGLNNSGDNIVIRDDNGVTLDSLTYSSEWYQDDNKDGGGYSLERINPNDPCTDFSDWRASNDVLGGTPGIENSIFDLAPDTQGAGISQLIALPPNFLEATFTEGMDSSSLSNAIITISPSLTVLNNYALGPTPTTLILEFVENLLASQVYTIELQNIADCWLNSSTVNGSFALPDIADAGDIIINEIMFNPLSGGSDWVELYNTSDKLIDVFNWELAGFSNDTISGNKIIPEHFLLYPDTYLIIGEDTLQILQNYMEYTLGRSMEIDIPSYANDEGTVYLIYQNQVMDAVSYLDDWHFELLDDEDGKSLERLNPIASSNDQNNWHTAAESIGFATPGKQNSQFYPAITNGEFSYTSETISPDNDGFEDVLQINYKLTEPGLIGNFTIYDDRGREVVEVLRSELMALEGTFVWDGVRSDNTKATIGAYIGFFEVLDLNGATVYVKKKVFAVAGIL